MSNRSSNTGNGNTSSQSLVSRNSQIGKKDRVSPFQQMVNHAREQGWPIPTSTKGVDFNVKN